MGHQQIYAKICVFALLGVNVGAYYFFWPKSNGADDKNPVVQEEPKPQPPSPTAPDKPPQVKFSPGDRPEIPNLEPIPFPPGVAEKKDSAEARSANEMVRKLLDHLREEKKNGTIAPLQSAVPKNQDGVTEELPPLPPEDKKPRPLPPLSADPLTGDLKTVDPGKIGITSPLKPKLPTGPWSVFAEKVGQQMLVTATLHAGTKMAIEFRILCDQIEKSPNGQIVLARGNVAFAAGGWKGHCQRLTLSLLEPSVLFEEKARIGHLTSPGELIGDRFVWELPGVAPPSDQGNPPIGVLGAPKAVEPDSK